MRERIKEIFANSARMKRAAVHGNAGQFEKTVRWVVGSLRQGGKILFRGNGGLADDSHHFTAEFHGCPMKQRQAMAAIALMTDSSTLTCPENDHPYEIIFSRQTEDLGGPGEVAFDFSTKDNIRRMRC